MSTKIELSSERAEKHYLEGVSYHTKGGYDNAIESKKQAIELSPENAEYHYSLGVSYHAKGEYDKAIENKKQAVELSPENAKYHESISNSYHAKGEYDEAIKFAKQAVELSPKNAEYHNSLGVSYHEKGEYDKAIENKKQAVELSPENAKYHYSLGVSYHNKGDYDKAIESKKQAVELSPENAKYHESISNSYHAKGEYDEAIKFAKQAVELSPKDAEYHYSLGVSYHEKGEYDKAIESKKQAVQLSPKSAKYLYSLAVSYYEKGVYKEAINFATKAIGLFPNKVKYHYLLGVSYYSIKDIAKAIETLHHAIRLDRSVADLYETLVFIHFKEWRYEDVERHKETVDIIIEGINTNNWNSEEISRILNIFYKKVNFESLANVLSRLKELSTDSIYYRIQKVLRSFEKYPDFHPKIANLHYLTAQIMNELSVKRDDDITLAHYTKAATIRHLIKPDKAVNATEKEKTPKIRLSNATYMNDPSEGTKLLEFFKSFGGNTLLKECCDSLIGSNEFEYKSSNVYLFSMTTYIDKLPMWSQYGDDGQGCCLELKKENFDYVDNELYHNIVMNDIEIPDGKDKLYKAKRDLPASYRYIPYKVYYFDNNPNEENDKIKENLNQIQSVIAELDELISQNDNSDLREQMKLYIIECLDQIRFLFKSNDYDHEQEARLLVYVPQTSEKIKLDETVELAPKLYVELDNNKGIEYSSIILGPKFKCPELIVPYIQYCNGDIKIKKSQVKYR